MSTSELHKVQEWNVDHGSLRVSAWHDLASDTVELQVKVCDAEGRTLLVWQLPVNELQTLHIGFVRLQLNLALDQQEKR